MNAALTASLVCFALIYALGARTAMPAGGAYRDHGMR